MDRSQVVFNADRCLHTQDKFSECAACYEICPTDAIIAGKPPVLNAEQCETCLACLPACPTGSFSADDDVTPLLKAASQLEGGTLEIVCGQNSMPELGATTSSTALRIQQCLAGLGSGAYAELAAMGFERILLRGENCNACKWSTLKPEIVKQTKQANQFLAAWGKKGFVEILENISEPVDRPVWNADSPPVSRRELFRMIANKSQTMMARAMENLSANTERRPGRDRLRLLGAAQHLPDWQPQAAPILEGMRFASVQITEACSACAVCAKACPTSALIFNKDVDGKHFALQFTASNCIDCGICMHVCAADAIEMKPDPTFAEIFGDRTVTLLKGNLTKCEHCGAAIAERLGIKLCAICEFRSKHAFGSALPKVVQMAIEARTKGKVQ